MMLSAKKVEEVKEKKMLPTINFLDTITIKTWGDLRKVIIDYGR